jgi:CBS domain-containing protein
MAEKQEQQGSGKDKDTVREVRRAGEMMTDRTAGTMRQAAQTGTDMLRRSTDVASRGFEAATEGQRRLLGDGAEQASRMGDLMAHAASILSGTAQETSGDVQALMMSTRAAASRMQDAQRAWLEFLTRNVQASARLPQDLIRCRSVQDLAEVQSRFVRESVNVLLDGSAEILRATGRAAEDALRPLEGRHQGGEGGGRQEHGRTVAEVMSRDIELASPNDTVQQAAAAMAKADAGILPVGEQDKLVGMTTDRDIAIRLAAEGKDPAKTKVQEVMTSEVKYCFEDDELNDVAENMAELQVRRLPVVNRQKRLVGIVSLGDLAQRQPQMSVGALQGVSRRGAMHNQAAGMHAGGKPSQGR